MATHKTRSKHLLHYLGLVLLACLLAAPFILQARSSQSMAIISGQGRSVEDVQRMIDTDIPLGSSKNQIEKWFKSRGIRYGYLDAKKGHLKYEPLANQSGLPIDNLSGMLTALVPGYSGKIIKCHTYIAFILDKDGKSIKRHISGARTNIVDRLEF